MSKAIHTADGESEGVNPACHKLYDVVQLSTYELKGSENITLRTVIATTPVDVGTALRALCTATTTSSWEWLVLALSRHELHQEN